MNKKFLSILICVISLVTIFSGCGKKEPDSNISLDKSEIILISGESEKLTLKKDDILLTDGIEWETSDKRVAIISDGVVKGLHTGETDVCAKFNGAVYVCKVVVVDKPSLSSESIKLETGKTRTLSLLAGTTVLKNVEWVIDNNSVATIENGLITAKSVGETLVRAKFKNKTYVCTLEVIPPFVLVGEFYCKITVAEMENQQFEFKINFTEDKKYVYTRLKNSAFEEWVNKGTYEKVDEKLVLTSEDGIINFEIVNESTLKSIGKMMTGGMEEQLTFKKI